MVILSIALAIGASTAIFSVVHAVLLNALPYQDPDRIVILWGTDKVNNTLENNTSVPNFEDWRKRTRTLENLATYREVEASFTNNGTGRLDRICGGLWQFLRPDGSRPSAGPNIQHRRAWTHRSGVEPSVVANAVWRFTPCPRSDGGVERDDITNRRRHAAGIRLPFRKDSSLDSGFCDTRVANPAKRKKSRFRSHSRPTADGDPR